MLLVDKEFRQNKPSGTQDGCSGRTVASRRGVLWPEKRGHHSLKGLQAPVCHRDRLRVAKSRWVDSKLGIPGLSEDDGANRGDCRK